MAIRYYDEAIVNTIKTWITDPELRVLKPDETTRLFQIREDITKDAPLTLPLITLSRDNSIELQVNVKNRMSFSGLKLNNEGDRVLTLDAIPISVTYQLDIYTRRYEEGDEYLRNFIFQFINNPKFAVYIPYNNVKLKHTFYLRLLSTITDNSDISEKLFADQFTRWTLQLELQDGYMFNVSKHIPYQIGVEDEGAILEVTSFSGDTIESREIIK